MFRVYTAAVILGLGAACSSEEGDGGDATANLNDNDAVTILSLDDPGTNNNNRTIATVYPDHCRNDEVDPDETDLNCGGACAPCTEKGNRCVVDEDCGLNLACGDDGRCDLARCENGARDIEETDIDCGGTDCFSRCSVGDLCNSSDDCRDGFGFRTACVEVETDGLIEKRCAEATCDDGIRNGGETAADCGRVCGAPCTQFRACEVNEDCAPTTFRIAPPTTRISDTDPVFNDAVYPIEDMNAVLASECADRYGDTCDTDAQVVYETLSNGCSEAEGYSGRVCVPDTTVQLYSCSRPAVPCGCRLAVDGEPAQYISCTPKGTQDADGSVGATCTLGTGEPSDALCNAPPVPFTCVDLDAIVFPTVPTFKLGTKIYDPPSYPPYQAEVCYDQGLAEVSESQCLSGGNTIETFNFNPTRYCIDLKDFADGRAYWQARLVSEPDIPCTLSTWQERNPIIGCNPRCLRVIENPSGECICAQFEDPGENTDPDDCNDQQFYLRTCTACDVELRFDGGQCVCDEVC